MTAQQPEALPSWTGDTDVDSALIMLDRIDCSHDDDARIDAVTATLRKLHARVQELEAQLVAEAARTANEKLRADQMTRQHRMQAAMASESRENLAQKDRKPLKDADIAKMASLSTKTVAYPTRYVTNPLEFARSIERAHGIKETK